MFARKSAPRESSSLPLALLFACYAKLAKEQQILLDNLGCRRLELRLWCVSHALSAAAQCLLTGELMTTAVIGIIMHSSLSTSNLYLPG